MRRVCYCTVDLPVIDAAPRNPDGAFHEWVPTKLNTTAWNRLLLDEDGLSSFTPSGVWQPVAPKQRTVLQLTECLRGNFEQYLHLAAGHSPAEAPLVVFLREWWVADHTYSPFIYFGLAEVGSNVWGGPPDELKPWCPIEV